CHGSDAREMVVLANYSFYFELPGLHISPLFLRSRYALGVCLRRLVEVPNPVIHSIRIVVYEGDLLRRIELRYGAAARAKHKSQVLMLGATHISVKEPRAIRVIKRSQDFCVNILHG